MKKITTYLLLALFSFGVALNSNAQKSAQLSENSELNASKIADHRIDIRVNPSSLVILRADCFKGQKKLNYKLKVNSESGKLVYSASLYKKGPIYKAYDVSHLPEGKYTFTVLRKKLPLYSKTILNKGTLNGNSSNKDMIVETL